jgi:hypothetical protein
VAVKDINVLPFETALLIKQPEAWLFENTLVVNNVKHVLCYFIPVCRNVLINQILFTRI